MSKSSRTNSFLRPLFHSWPVALLTMLAGIFAAKKYLRYSTPVYESVAKIKLADIHAGVPNGNLYKNLDIFANTNQIGAEVELIRSKVLVKKAVEGLGIDVSIYRIGDIHKTELYDQSPFSVSFDLKNTKAFDRPYEMTITRDSLVELTTPSGELIHSKLNAVIETKDGVIVLKRNNTLLAQRPSLAVNDRYEFIIGSEDHFLDDVIAHLDVMAVDKDVAVLRISYKSTVPQKAADVVNAVSAAYINDYINEKFRTADTTAQFLDSQLQQFSGKLRSSENAIENYRTTHNIVNIQQETETDLRKIADLKKQLASVQMNLNAIDSLNVYMGKGKDRFLDLAPNFEAFTDLLSTELIKKTKELQRERHDLLMKYTPEHEKVKTIDEKLEDISSYMQESVHNTETNLRIKYRDLQQTIEESEKVFIGLPTREKNMIILERNFGMNEQTYRFLREKRTEAEIAKAATISFHRIISAGEVPSKPVSPNSIIIRMMAAILGLGSGITLIYLVHGLRARPGNRDMISRLSDLPVITGIPFFSRKQAPAQTAFFKKFVLELQFKSLLPRQATIVISSATGKEGLDFVFSNLEKALRSLGKKVLIIRIPDQPVQVSTPEIWNEYLRSISMHTDVILIRNSPLNTDPSSLVPMTTATSNLLVADGCASRKQVVTELEEICRSLDLPQPFLVLNRENYHPGLYTQCRHIIRYIFGKQKSFNAKQV